ncbi:hypothetical protein [Streptomyces sp. NPDC052225]|uniref:hypothetical protein n=1 Tax=Streptomyces sp. NPDC052225 TaxID=3154949 RepID=UPI00342DAB60
MGITGWDTRVRAVEKGPRRVTEVEVAAAVCVAQWPVIGLAALIWWADATNDYGQGYGGALGVIGFACMLLFVPPLCGLFGWAQAAVQVWPALRLGDLAARRAPGPGWAGRTACALACALVWAVPFALLGVCSYGTGAVLCAAVEVLPLLAVLRARRRPIAAPRLWLTSVLGGFAAVILTLVCGIAVSVAGLTPRYEPPHLTTAELAGVWRGEDGAELRLTSGGRARAVRLPYDYEWDADSASGESSLKRCEGGGTWRWTDSDDFVAGDPGIDLDACDTTLTWTIGGTAERPELYYLFGDPDSGELRILRRV